MKDHIEGLGIDRIRLSDMFSDKRYMGGENFPKIMEPELFKVAQQMKKEGHKAMGKEQFYIYYKKYFLLGDKMERGEYGSGYCCYKHGDKQIWDCSKRTVEGRVHCRNQRTQEAQTKELFMQVIIRMKNHPERVRKVTMRKFKRSIRLQAAGHEIKLLKDDSSHNIDELLELICKRTSLQYEDSDDGGTGYYTNKIVDLLQQHKEQTEEKTFDKGLFESMTQTIIICKGGRMMFIPRDGVNVTEMLPQNGAKSTEEKYSIKGKGVYHG